MSRDGYVALPLCAMGLSAVCDCDISRSYSLFLKVLRGQRPNFTAIGDGAPCVRALHMATCL